MKWLKLDELQDDVIREGSVIRAYLSYLEEFTDFLVFSPNEAERGEGLIYVTGFHAGQIYVVFPRESAPEDAMALSRNWLIENWTKWVDQNGDIGKVYVSERYPNPTKPAA